MALSMLRRVKNRSVSRGGSRRLLELARVGAEDQRRVVEFKMTTMIIVEYTNLEGSITEYSKILSCQKY